MEVKPETCQLLTWSLTDHHLLNTFFLFFPLPVPIAVARNFKTSFVESKLTIKRNIFFSILVHYKQAAKAFPTCPGWKFFLLFAQTPMFCTLVHLYGVSNSEQSLYRRSPEMAQLPARAPVIFVAELQGIMSCQEKWYFFLACLGSLGCVQAVDISVISSPRSYSFHKVVLHSIIWIVKGKLTV